MPLPLSAAALLIFLAVCAYTGAWIFEDLCSGLGCTELREVSIRESADLNGIIIRREQAICSLMPERPLPENGERVAAGRLLARSYEGEEILSQSSSLFFRRCDGYEYLSPDMLLSLSPSELEKLIDRKPEKDPFSIGRLVEGCSWYYAALCEDSPLLPQRGECRIIFSGRDESLSARLIYKSPPEQGRVMLLLRLCSGAEEYMSMRKTGAQIIFSEYTGLKIPVDAVYRDTDGNDFVYTLTAGFTEKKTVEIIYRAGDYCVAALKSEPDSLREGSIIAFSGNYIC